MSVPLLSQLRAFIRRDYLQAGASPLALLWQLAAVVFATPMLFYLGRLIRPGASPHLAPFGDDYFAFVVIGVAFFGFLSSCMGASAGALRGEQLTGTLEPLFMTPVRLPALAVGLSLWQMTFAAAQALLYALLGGVVFGIRLTQPNYLSALLVILLSAGIFVAVGMMAAAFVLVFRHGDPFTTVFAAASVLLAGVLYPPSVLPPVLERLSRLIPLTYALRALRLALLRGDSPWALRQDLGVLILMAVVLLPLGTLLLRAAAQEARRAGTLAAY